MAELLALTAMTILSWGIKIPKSKTSIMGTDDTIAKDFEGKLQSLSVQESNQDPSYNLCSELRPYH